MEASSFDKVFITTLFTFDFDMCVEAIRYYTAVVGVENVYVGGIAATIMPERFLAEIPKLQLLPGQLTSSNILGYEDDINIDALDLDYDILWDVPYVYPTADSYFIYTTRGCPRKCTFCAVKSLEPQFLDCPNVREQITRMDARFGIKKQLLIMDNNILYSDRLESTVQILEELGFGTTNNVIQKGCNIKFSLQSLWRRIQVKKDYRYLFDNIKQQFIGLNLSRVNASDKEMLLPAILSIKDNDDVAILDYLKTQQEFIVDFYTRYHYHKIKRYVDFNQGLDARLLTPERARSIGRLAIKPCRIAFDDVRCADEYFDALNAAVDHGIRHFSNYLLYNYRDKPVDLWTRLHLNVEYCIQRKEKLTLFSFPMKYASIEHTDRNYIGKFWNKKYLKSINVILNVTKGVVAKEKDFFVHAYGNNESEYLEILTLPDDFIRYREYFEQNSFVQKWLDLYRKLNEADKTELLDLLAGVTTETEVPSLPHSERLHSIVQFYSIKKNDMDRNKLYYIRLVESLYSLEFPSIVDDALCLNA